MFHVLHDTLAPPPTRSFEEYRYAIEAGLISPHAVRHESLPWENTSPHTTRVTKRYHDHEDAYAVNVTNKENAETQ